MTSVLIFSSSWPSKVLLDKLIEYFIMRSIKFLQDFICAGFHFRLWSSLRLVETFVPGAAPLTVGQPHFLTAAVEALGGVEEEVVLSYLIWYLQEGLQLPETRPRLLDELVPVHNMYLL